MAGLSSRFLEAGHEIGNAECPVCWSDGVDGMCVTCGEGLVHAEFEDEDLDNVYLVYCCDQCGDPSKPMAL